MKRGNGSSQNRNSEQRTAVTVKNPAALPSVAAVAAGFFRAENLFLATNCRIHAERQNHPCSDWQDREQQALVCLAS